MRKIKATIKEELDDVRQEISNKTVGYIVTALGLVAGLAWNDAVKTAIEYIFPAQENTLMAKFIYATTITLVVVFISVYLTKFFRRDSNCPTDKAEENKKETKRKK
jgi:uncharacterized BrkB/YihY/UPF0761 family membrane protein